MIEVRNLVKKYGNHLAIDHLDFKLEAGRVYGFFRAKWGGKIYYDEHYNGISGSH